MACETLLLASMRHVLFEAIEAACPTTPMPVAFLGRLEWNLTEGHLGLSIPFGEGDGHHRLEAALALFLPGEGEDDEFRRNDLAEYASEAEFLAVAGRPQAAAPDSAGPDVHLQVSGGVVPRA